MENGSKLGILACLVGQLFCLEVIGRNNQLEYAREKQEESFLVDEYYQDQKHIRVYRSKKDPSLTWKKVEDIE